MATSRRSYSSGTHTNSNPNDDITAVILIVFFYFYFKDIKKMWTNIKSIVYSI